ncbi:kinase-like protein [Bimuria novae-zelandiae CBS 107.79]|uniref:EKC/KEOPS complex subunit BUD32 n=1 Tax=Bimuria novae-zelandiae CBS 107.79 TaxID=1447943 RepID=A0A6A5UGV1_9PLEO|nr:kinase-like protein [Bimuria novae-zelandiae CBS 107.79]
MSDEIKYPRGFGLKDLSSTIIKTPLHEDCSDLISRERTIYKQLDQQGGHKGILRYYRSVQSRIRLEYAPNGNLRSFIHQNNIAQALTFVHRARVIHRDLTCHNVLLDKKLNIRLSDFAGSSLDGSPLLIAVTASHEYPGPTLSIQGDLFAFSSVLYEIMTGNAPYGDLTKDKILNQYSKGDFPNTKFLQAIGDVIRKCWQSEYNRFELVLADLNARNRTLTFPSTPDVKTSILVSLTVAATIFVLFRSISLGRSRLSLQQ